MMIHYIIKTAAGFVKQGRKNGGENSTKQSEKQDLFLEEIFWRSLRKNG